jgi:hypothetical protein
MKIEFETVNCKWRTKKHLTKAVEYICSILEHKEDGDFMGLPFYRVEIPDIGGKDFGDNIGTQDNKMFLQCRKTKGGVFKVKVWGE